MRSVSLRALQKCAIINNSKKEYLEIADSDPREAQMVADTYTKCT